MPGSDASSFACFHYASMPHDFAVHSCDELPLPCGSIEWRSNSSRQSDERHPIDEETSRTSLTKNMVSTVDRNVWLIFVACVDSITAGASRMRIPRCSSDLLFCRHLLLSTGLALTPMCPFALTVVVVRS